MKKRNRAQAVVVDYCVKKTKNKFNLMLHAIAQN